MFPRLRCVYFNHRVVEPRTRQPAPVTFWQLYWNRQPGMVLIHPEGEEMLTADRFVLVPAGAVMGYRVDRPTWHLHLHVAIDWPDLPKAPPVVIRRVEGHHRAWLEHLMTESGPTRDLAGRGAAAALALVSDCLVEVVPDNHAPPIRDPRVDRAIGFLREHLHRPIANDELADLVGLSTNGFIRLFTRQVGRSPQRVFTDLRLQRAAELLVYTDERIADVAQACGFGSRSFFSTVFARRHGMGPAAFRRAGRREVDPVG